MVEKFHSGDQQNQVYFNTTETDGELVFRQLCFKRKEGLIQRTVVGYR
ncbi:hypothetical protein LEP1GSC166_1561 [Leptospira kirschneri]|nr:hypothetical protein LEP1GSC198_2981 [Leptospira kirschneri str. JB]EMK05830.1 hypothetical protein LEP1GSC166_1561 [Leptospira kirschneri]